jgi:hypothetical protein
VYPAFASRATTRRWTPSSAAEGIGLGKLLADGLRKRPPVRRHGTAGAMGCREGSGSAWAAWNVTSVSPHWLSVVTPRHKCLTLMVGAARFELATPSPPDWCANQAALRSEPDGDVSPMAFRRLPGARHASLVALDVPRTAPNVQTLGNQPPSCRRMAEPPSAQIALQPAAGLPKPGRLLRHPRSVQEPGAGAGVRHGSPLH